MGLFDSVKGAAENAAGEGMADNLIEKGVDQAENFAEEKTGGRFNDQIEQGGDMVEGQIKNQVNERFGN